MKTRILTTLAVAIAMALPIGGALAQTGSSSSDVSADSAADIEVSDAGATPPVAQSTSPIHATGPDDVPPAPTEMPLVTTPRPSKDEPTTDRPEREWQREAFPVEDAGTVTVTWSQDAILDVEAHPDEDWHHRIHRDDRRTVHVGFVDGRTAYQFTAHVAEDGQLHTRIVEHEHERDPEVRTDRFEIGDAGTVTVTYSAEGIHDVRVHADDGWKHRVERRDPRTAHVGFHDGHTTYVFSAHVTRDGRLRTHTQRDDGGPTIQDRSTDSMHADLAHVAA